MLHLHLQNIFTSTTKIAKILVSALCKNVIVGVYAIDCNFSHGFLPCIVFLILVYMGKTYVKNYNGIFASIVYTPIIKIVYLCKYAM